MVLEKKIRTQDEKVLEEVRSNPCIVCGKKPSDPAHIKSRGAGGPDVPENLLPLCRIHHSTQLQVCFLKMMDLHVGFYESMLERGWEIRVENGRRKLWNPKLNLSL